MLQTSYDNDDYDYNCFVRSFQGTGISNDNDDDKLFLSATYQNGQLELAVVVLDI